MEKEKELRQEVYELSGGGDRKAFDMLQQNIETFKGKLVVAGRFYGEQL